ncbi:polyphosphate:AMP phosphotransferase [Acinetobacter larvae]|uniref:Phosphate--AMP phosphotransferase n=1 Tax=Acinetobacter larvae TaxID=1789224 RepID=A0A1B2LW30_9GAMM|nr:phosphate--AMP phosphotransferase [Acinetobacter larvae]AOA57168.1 phosphate--AMP phosphotransferase [Acinetobacter larvae]
MIEQHKFELMDAEQLTLKLIEAQYTLKNSRGTDHAKSLVVIVSGIELAGKGEAVKQLREWLDPRYLQVKADIPNLFTQKQSFWQPYAPFIPAEGEIQIMFGNWYSDLLATANHVSEPFDVYLFDDYVERMRAFEQDLKNNHCDVIKIWFDLSWKSLQKRLDHLAPAEQRWHKLHGLNWRNKKQYDNLQRLRQRFTRDWIIIDCEDAAVRDQKFAQYVLQALRHLPKHYENGADLWQQAQIPEALLHPRHAPTDQADYKKRLKKLTNKVAAALRNDQRRIIICFEGMDAAGKGGAIKRIVKKLDPREYSIFTISAPEKFQLRHPYLWRFWNNLQDKSNILIFDRTWYGRVLVERVEGFATAKQWQRAYAEINRFEKDLSDNQTLLIKFWLAISKDEQALRFQSREQTAHKRFKITDEDRRNRSKWPEYLDAAADMLALTDTDYAPWHVIATDDKYTARLEILTAILAQLLAADG